MTSWLSVDMMNPLTNSMLTASCEKANFGWPCDAEVEKLRDAFARAPDLRKAARRSPPTCRRAPSPTARTSISASTRCHGDARPGGVVTSPIPVFWNIEKK